MKLLIKLLILTYHLCIIGICMNYIKTLIKISNKLKRRFRKLPSNERALIDNLSCTMH